MDFFASFYPPAVYILSIAALTGDTFLMGSFVDQLRICSGYETLHSYSGLGDYVCPVAEEVCVRNSWNASLPAGSGGNGLCLYNGTRSRQSLKSQFPFIFPTVEPQTIIYKHKGTITAQLHLTDSVVWSMP
jgi:hypothetical protein